MMFITAVGVLSGQAGGPELGLGKVGQSLPEPVGLVFA